MDFGKNSKLLEPTPSQPRVNIQPLKSQLRILEPQQSKTQDFGLVSRMTGSATMIVMAKLEEMLLMEYSMKYPLLQRKQKF